MHSSPHQLEEIEEQLQRAKIKTSQHLAPPQCRYGTIQAAIDFCGRFYHDKARCCFRDLIQSVLNKCARGLRPKGPPGNSPGRQAGVKDMTKFSAEGAALTALMVPHLRRSISLQSNPGLTAGPIAFRPFGPYCHMSIHL